MLPEYVEVGPRLYRVEVVPESQWEWGASRCNVDLSEQVVSIISSVPVHRRDDLLRRAAQKTLARRRVAGGPPA